MRSRDLMDALRRSARTFPVAVVTGPRQSGKTTLLRDMYGDTHAYLSLEDPDIRALARADPRGFLRLNPPPVILDEIQYAPELPSYIKTLVDADRCPGHWLLTGSQNFLLMEQVGQSLAGRAAILTLLPYSWHERRPSRPEAEVIVRGLFPEISENDAVDRQIWCASYIQTYLERDIRQILQVQDLGDFERFLRLAAARTGQLLNVADLARDAAISQTTARRWLSALEASYTIFLLPPYHASFGKRLVKSPKLYFVDTGLASYLLGIHDAQVLRRSPFWGAFFETLIVGEWLKGFRARGELPSLYFWRSSDQIEVDVVVEYQGELHGFEIKAGETLTPGDGGALKKWRELGGIPAENCALLAPIPRPLPLGAGIVAHPWTLAGWDWLAQREGGGAGGPS